MKTLIPLISILSISFLGLHQNPGSFGSLDQNSLAGFEMDTIPFHLTEHNNISIQAVLNHQDTVNLMFHTAANSISLTQAAVKKGLNVNFSSSETSKSWGGTGSSRRSFDNSLQIGDMEWEKLEVWENMHSGPGTDGKFGPNLFEDKIVEIDFEAKHMIIHDALPAEIKSFERHDLNVENDMMFLEGIVEIEGEEVEQSFLIHSGYAGSLLFDDVFVERHKMGEKLKIISEKSLKDAAGNTLKTQKAILDQFKIGNAEFDQLPIGFFAGAIGRQKMSVMGGDLLKRFDVVFDFQHNHIYLRRNGLLQVPFGDF